MSSTTVAPRFERGPTLPEIAGVIAGIIALAIALAPSLSQRDADDGSAGAPAELALAPVDAGPSDAPAELRIVPDDDLPAAPTAGGAMASCGPDALGDASAPGAFCPLPPREPASKEARFVGLSFSWPPRRAAEDR